LLAINVDSVGGILAKVAGVPCVDPNAKILMRTLDVGAVVLVFSLVIMQKLGRYGRNSRVPLKLHERTDVNQ
jgi:hypothetical protein